MVSFSNDADILKYEPVLFGELHLPWQVLAAGTGGALSGTTFTASGADFVNAQVLTGGVINLRSADGLLDGAYEITVCDWSSDVCSSDLRRPVNWNPTSPACGPNVLTR